MICDRCQTALPDEALACWKCGTPTMAQAAHALQAKKKLDPFLAILALVIGIAFFVCAGWAVPFTVWGLLTNWTNEHPQWSGALNVLTGAAFVLTTVGVFGGTCWGIYVALVRLSGPK